MISIVVPVYNAEKYIADTIRTVCLQTYQDWELILVDDCSQDGSVQVIREEIRRWERAQEAGAPGEQTPQGNAEAGTARGRIRLIGQKENRGAAAARNTGTEAAQGRYLAFLDADDLWYPEKLARELAFMQAQDAPMAFTSYQFGDEEGRPTGKAARVPKTLTFEKALTRTVIFTSTVLIDLEKIPKRLVRMPDMASEDTATWWTILKSGYTAYGLDELLVIYRRPAASLSSDKFQAVKRIWNLYRKVAGISAGRALVCLAGWAVRATKRRLIKDRA